MKPVRLRPSAKADLSDEADYYADRVGAELANAFVDEALQALDTLGAQPGIGSPRWSEPDQVPVLRSWRVSRFHSVWLYLERDDHVDVVRLVGERQDMAAILRAGFD